MDRFSLALAQPIASLRRYGLAARPVYNKLLPPPVRAALFDYAHGPLALLPGVLLLAAIQIATLLGNWQADQVMVLGIALTGGMLSAAVFLPAIGRRASVYVATGDYLSLRHYVCLSVAFLGVAGVAVIASILIATGQLGILSPETRIIFALSSLGLGCIWLLGGWLSLLRQSGWLMLGLAAGLVTFVIIDRLLALVVSFHLAPAAIAGFGMAIGLEVRVLYQQLWSKPDGTTSKPAIPTPAYLAWESAPYLAYGFASMLFVILPHALGWLGVTTLATGQLSAFAHVEIALTLSMPPIVLAGGITEHTLRLFWIWSQDQLEAVSGDQPGLFRYSANVLYRKQLGLFVVAVITCGALVGLVVQAAIAADPAPGWMSGLNRATVIVIFMVSLASYGFLAVAYFNASICLTLNRPTAVLPAGAVGLLTMAILGIPLCLFLDYRHAVIAFLAGSFVFAVLTARSVTQVLDSSDYHFFASG